MNVKQTILLTFGLLILLPAAALMAQQPTSKFIAPFSLAGSVIDADDLGNGTVFVAADCGNVFRSFDNGDTWDVTTAARGSRLHGIDMVDAQRGTIVGWDGISHTTNGGNSWFQDPTAPTTRARKVKWVTDSIGYVGGDSSMFIKTTDAGNSWVDVSPGSTQYWVTDFDFRTPDEGVVAFFRDEQFYTSDGGATWVDLADSTQNIEFVRFDPMGVAHAFGDGVGYATSTNGGLSWSTTTFADPLRDITDVSFPADSIGYAYSSTFRFLKTTDAGQTWDTVSVPNPLNLQGFGVQIEFSGANEGFVFEGLVPLRTSDGGNSFDQMAVDLELALGILITDMHAVSANELWATTFFSTAPSAGLFHTTDAGLSWDKVEIDSVPVPRTVHFLSSNVGFVGGSQPVGVARTSDGGQTWTPIPHFNTQLDVVREFDFSPSGNLGIAIGDESISYTTDQGITWSQGTPLDYVVPFIERKVAVPSDLVAYAIAEDSVMKTLDGGQTWATILVTTGGPNSPFPSLFDVMAPHPDTVMVARDSSRLMYSYDGGTTWGTRFVAGTQLDYGVTGIEFLDSKRGYWVDDADDRNYIFQTLDGGINWTPIDINNCTGREVLEVLDEDRLWIGGLGGMIIQVDAPFAVGNWEPQPEAWGYSLHIAEGAIELGFEEVLRKEGKAVLVDLQGKTVQTWDLAKGSAFAELELGRPFHGMYLLKVESDELNGYHKLLFR